MYEYITLLLLFVVKQHNPFNKQWHTISHYNKSGNFLGPAIFETKQEAQDYLEEYKRKLLLHITNTSSANNQKQQQQYQEKLHRYNNDNNNKNNNKNITSKRRAKGRPSRNENIRLKVFQESTLPRINKPSFFHRSN